MNYYFIALLILYAMAIGINMARHGQPRKDKYNFYTSLLSFAINVILLYFAIKTGF